jgi:opacity protein-like surface antigen
MKPRYYVPLAAFTALWSAAVSAERQPGWEFGAEVIYQDAQNINFKGGSFASLEDDVGIAMTLGYRFSKRLELQFSMDWNTVDYEASVVSGTVGELGFTAEGDLEAFTPRVALNFNLLEGALTPYVTGGVGWSFIDTNIPDAPAQTSCWWDPWYGYYCGTWQSTRSIDDLVYNLGVGARWDVSSTFSMHLGYEKHWLDLGEATSTPGFDQLKFGIAARY